MALIKCSECGKKVSEKAKACSNCGDDIQKQVEAAKQKAAERKALADRKWAELPTSEKISRIIICGFLALLLFSIAKCALTPKTPEEIEEGHKRGAIGACRMFIERQLNDPDSMEIIHNGNKAMHVEGNIYETNVAFRAKNAFGASIPASYHCIVRLEGDDFHLVSLKKNR